jgi:hypothetical protein
MPPVVGFRVYGLGSRVRVYDLVLVMDGDAALCRGCDAQSLLPPKFLRLCFRWYWSLLTPCNPKGKPPMQALPKPPMQALPKPPMQALPKPPMQALPKPPMQVLPKPPIQVQTVYSVALALY